MKFLCLFALTAAVGISVVALAPAQAQETRIFVDGLGHEVEIPVKPKRIVSLRGEQFTAPLVEMGAPIVASVGDVVEGVNDGRPVIRGAYELFHTTFENSDIAFVGTTHQPDVEAIAALKPDLILVPDFAAENYSRYSVVAPTVVIKIWSNPARERYRRIADATGMLDAFERLANLYDFRLGEARHLIEEEGIDAQDIVVAVAEVNGKRLRVFKHYDAMTAVLSDLGFSRPEVVDGLNGERLDLSPEQLQSIDGDFLVSSYSERRFSGPSELRANWDNLIPGWDAFLHAPRHNQHILIPREIMRALSFRALEEVLAIYMSNIVTRKFVPFED
ncbi:hypothetical protein EOI86_22605 [Hwanghaeella grinnelliae]|uniref:Fe/B12 periplasmic-binding domain-containing protein n=1 Tax=Hwanghaeella grinnelliae TaxID=2500179 RepID=A0A437QH81_9PROT|nr:ABC transporter substrate-binding protein [Hwanghaeella grinnelliae]RVU33923.1 hypothetical protein EOI86_22605 [Hwanghaeella grinnelliae]